MSTAAIVSPSSAQSLAPTRPYSYALGYLKGFVIARNSFGIFLIHYAIVSWLGYALLGAPLPVLIKFLLVLAGSLGLSWMDTALLRRIPGVARVL
jgi:surface polysaccharide O-acyltransferase-like enzyme